MFSYLFYRQSIHIHTYINIKYLFLSHHPFIKVQPIQKIFFSRKKNSPCYVYAIYIKLMFLYRGEKMKFGSSCFGFIYQQIIIFFNQILFKDIERFSKKYEKK